MKISLVAALVMIGTLALPAGAAEFTKGDIKVSTPWTRATPGGARVAGGYLTITNTGTKSDRLVGGTAPFAGVVEIHQMTMTGNVMKMSRLPKGLEVKPGATVMLKPGSYHIMFMQLKSSLTPGQRVKGTLVFEKAGTINVEYQIEKIGAQSPGAQSPMGAGAGMSHGSHGAMKHR